MTPQTPTLPPLNERVAALEAVQARHDGDISKLSDKIDNLERKQEQGFSAISAQIKETNSNKARAITAAISGGAAIGGGLAVGLYQLLHTFAPHIFGG